MTYVKCMALMFKGTSLKQQAFPPTSYGHYDTAASVGFVLSDSVAHSIVCFNKVVLSSWSQRMWQVLWGGARGYGVGAKGYGNHESILSFPGTGVLSISHSHSAFRIPHSSFPIPHSPFLDPHYPFPSPKSPIPVPNPSPQSHSPQFQSQSQSKLLDNFNISIANVWWNVYKSWSLQTMETPINLESALCFLNKSLQ